MTLVLRWRVPDPPIVTRWRYLDQVTAATVARAPETPLAAIVGPPGERGLTGADGPPTNPNTLFEAGEAIGGHRAVFVAPDGKLWLADPATAVASPPIGISVGAGAAGAQVPVRSTGLVTESSWSWAGGPIYLGAGGLLTQVVPTAIVMFLIGVSAGPTKMRLDPRLIAAF